MEMHQEQTLTVADLRFLSLKCENCGTETVVDLETTYRPDPEDRTGVAPAKCPTCEQRFDPDARRAANSLLVIYTTLVKRAPGSLSIRVRGAS